MVSLGGLLKVGSMADSLGAYIPAKIMQKVLGFARLLLLMYLLDKSQWALWGLGMFIAEVAGPMITQLVLEAGCVGMAIGPTNDGRVAQRWRSLR